MSGKMSFAIYILLSANDPYTKRTHYAIIYPIFLTIPFLYWFLSVFLPSFRPSVCPFCLCPCAVFESVSGCLAVSFCVCVCAYVCLCVFVCCCLVDGPGALRDAFPLPTCPPAPICPQQPPPSFLPGPPCKAFCS